VFWAWIWVGVVFWTVVGAFIWVVLVLVVMTPQQNWGLKIFRQQKFTDAN
jgi:hypothetical protein